MKIISFFVCVFFFAIPYVVFSQKQETATIKGVISDSEGKRLEYVNISILGISKPIGTFSNKKGEYLVKIPANTPVSVEFSSIGYEKQSFDVTLSSNETKILDGKLILAIKNLPTPVIEGRHVHEGGVVSLPTGKIEVLSVPNNGIETLIKSMPGTSSVGDEMSSQYSVRGGSFDENLVYINGVEIPRPFLIRSGQQEGLSIINPNMVSNVLFSTGGFGAQYGDKMSSVLDISYKKAQSFGGSATASLLGASLYIKDFIKNKLSYNIGFRQHSNRYLLRSLEKKGSYRPSYTDLQAYLDYQVNSKLSLSFLGIYSRNIYQLIPETQETTFGNQLESLKLMMYFDGEEKDSYRTLLGNITATYIPNNISRFQYSVSTYNNKETETYDIKSEYWLYKTDEGNDSLLGGGIGTYLEHARNYLKINVINTEFKALHAFSGGNMDWGIKYQNEIISDRLNEWNLIDSSGYTIPLAVDFPGQNYPPSPPMLQDIVNAKNSINTHRFSGYVSKNWTLYNKKEDVFQLQTGIRAQYWSFNQDILASPRIKFSYQPHNTPGLTLRLSTGVYSQAPFYREYRNSQGDLNHHIKAQKSYQAVAGLDKSFTLWERPFMLTTELYYKHITDLNPYKIDNLRIQYSAQNNGIGYATGIDIRLNGEFVKDVESWISVTLMQTQEKIKGSSAGYRPRPTDQRFIFNLFFQDYVPSFPWLRMNILFVYASGVPFTKPNQADSLDLKRLPPYMRADWGTSVQLKELIPKWKANKNSFIKNAWLTLELFNLLDIRNVISYLWVSDYENKQYGVPNYLTRRQLNFKFTVDF